MTRDEAIDEYLRAVPGNNRAHGEAAIQCFVNLGMLKLDEPKRKDRLADAIMSTGLAEPNAVDRINALCEIMDRCGLKIVSK